MPTRHVDEFDGAVASLVSEKVNCFLALASPVTYANAGMRLTELALQHRLAGMFGFKENTQAGGLMSYSTDVLDLYRRSAVYIDKILNSTVMEADPGFWRPRWQESS